MLAIGVLLAWATLNWRYSGQIENLQSGTKLRDDTIANYKEKLSGATPEEAKTRLDALELQVAALSPRRLTEKQKAQISQMAATKIAHIAITMDLAASDARAFTRDLALAFQASGWIVSLPQVMGLGNPPPSGIALKVLDPASLRMTELLVKNALEAAGIHFDVQSGLMNTPRILGAEMPPDPDVEILVSSRLAL